MDGALLQWTDHLWRNLVPVDKWLDSARASEILIKTALPILVLSKGLQIIVPVLSEGQTGYQSAMDDGVPVPRNSWALLNGRKAMTRVVSIGYLLQVEGRVLRGRSLLANDSTCKQKWTEAKVRIKLQLAQSHHNNTITPPHISDKFTATVCTTCSH